MNTNELWRIAKPWTEEQWREIISDAVFSRLARSAAKIQRSYGDLSDAMTNEYHARCAEQRVRLKAEILGRDIDETRLE